MPYINIKITREGATREQKAELIAGVTDLMVRVLDKSPATTFVVIDEVEIEDWGIGGMPVDEFRARNRREGSRPSDATAASGDRATGESWSFRRSSPR